MTLLDKLNALEADKDELAYWSPRYGKWMAGLTISEVRAMAESHEELLKAAKSALAIDYDSNGMPEVFDSLDIAISQAEALQETK